MNGWRARYEVWRASLPEATATVTLATIETEDRQRTAIATPVAIVTPLSVADDVDLIAERAAIIQEGATVPADWADGFARLCHHNAPPGVDALVWRHMIDAAGRFLDKWGAQANALGWTAGELFGLDPAAPINRDRRGAVMFLTGGEVVAITATEITIKTGAEVQRLRRQVGPMAAAWDTNIAL